MPQIWGQWDEMPQQALALESPMPLAWAIVDHYWQIWPLERAIRHSLRLCCRCLEMLQQWIPRLVQQLAMSDWRTHTTYWAFSRDPRPQVLHMVQKPLRTTTSLADPGRRTDPASLARGARRQPNWPRRRMTLRWSSSMPRSERLTSRSAGPWLRRRSLRPIGL